MRKILYIVLDGLGDRPSPDLDGMTPLEDSRLPYMGSLLPRAKLGLMHPVGEGIAPESDVAVISILGYDAAKYYTGRGPLECHATGLKVQDGELAYRVNFATLGKGKEIVDRRVGRNLSSQEAGKLAEAVNSGVNLTKATFDFKSTVGHRGVLLIRSQEGKLSGQVTNTDPAYGRKGVFGVAREKFVNEVQDCQPLSGFEDDEKARRSARLTNEFMEKSHELLEKHPVNEKRKSDGNLPGNLILTRDAGDRLPQLPPLREQQGVNFCCFVEMPVERGIALLTGMEIVEIPQPTGDPSQDYPLRASKALRAMSDYDGLYIHIKGPDEPGHDGDAVGKKKIIEAIDRHFFGELLPHINIDDVVIAVTADHSTPCTLRAHSDDPVPLLIAGGDISPDGIKSFSEKSCLQGSIDKIAGPELLPLLVKYTMRG